ncbi:DNA polymerase I isoform X3 [Tripterygium wilfordii]|uniref:DNA polymerase I isoform X3 n=1 Tax=Tripterygium wilfordii TaxID=458696 RepID=UPI0018F81930|nr:DNA polymerase I isoform X3 [Tripterygium wilfordii]
MDGYPVSGDGHYRSYKLYLERKHQSLCAGKHLQDMLLQTTISLPPLQHHQPVSLSQSCSVFPLGSLKLRRHTVSRQAIVQHYGEQYLTSSIVGHGLNVNRFPSFQVLDGEGGYEHRRQILPSYKAHRRKFLRQIWTNQKLSKCNVGSSHQVVTDVLRKCNVPVIKIDGHEADDVVATLVSQVVKRGYRAVIASPDKDFKQLISEDVQIVMPLAELDRWSFYTLKHYIAQYNCDPLSDLSLRCIIGDDVDGVPGIQHVVPGFGRKTAVKLLKKHGSLEKLLNAASVRTVGRSYAQDALKNYADYLRRNYEVLALRRDVDIHLEDDWLEERDTHSDSNALANLFRSLEETQKCIHQNKSHSSKV